MKRVELNVGGSNYMADKKNLMIFCIFLLLWSVASNSFAADKPSGIKLIVPQSQITGSYGVVSASRTTGVAPLSVSFSTDFSGTTNSLGFHEYDYSWDFGDPFSGVWGTNGKSKNSATGGSSAHVFESAGTYSVRLTVRNQTGVIGTEFFSINVQDPNEFYAGTKTTCVNPAGDTNFSGAPAGSRQVSTDTISTITQYATAGSRILFKRGGSWTTPDISNWPQNAGPVTIGAYGTGTNPDAYGIFENAPSITVTGEAFLHLDRKQDWRIMDIAFKDPARLYNTVTGVTLMQRQLFLRLKITGFKTGMGWGHWNNATGPQIDQMAVVSCVLTDAAENVMYAGSERLALLGNKIENAHTSHVTRVWQAYKGVVSNNILAGSSISSTSGRMSLKLHGPNAQELASAGWDHLSSPTAYTIISDNIIGSSGPWPICIGPTDDWTDCRITNLVFERNRYCGDYGTRSPGSNPLYVSLRFHGRQSTIRNNIFDAANFGPEITGVYIVGAGLATPTSADVWVYNNTVYKTGNPDGLAWEGINIGTGVLNAIVRNNLVVFPYTSSRHYLVRDLGIGTIQTNNILNGTVDFVDPSNTVNPLARSFALTVGSSSAIDKGYSIPSVFEDFAGNSRPSGTIHDIGAYEYTGN